MIWNRKQKWLGHVLSHSGMLHDILDILEGKDVRGNKEEKTDTRERWRESAFRYR